MRHYKVTDGTYSKVSLESLGPLVCKVATDLAVVANVQPMQFIQPVWNWLEEAQKKKHQSLY
jgi:hypothetical protein